MRAAGPVVDPLPCSGCGKLLDPLRAGHVAIFDDRLHYFCSVQHCRAAFLAPYGGELPAQTSPSPVATTLVERPPRVEEPGTPLIQNALSHVVPEDILPEPVATEDDRSLVEPIERGVASHAALGPDAEPRDVGGLLLLIAVVAGALAVLLGLTSGGRIVLLSRVVLASVGVATLLARTLTVPRSPADPHPLPVLAGPVAAIGLAVWAALRARAPIASEAVALAGTVTTFAAIGAWLLEMVRGSVETERAYVAAAMDVPGRRIPSTDGAPIEDGVYDICPGERVLCEEGEEVPVDLVVSEGEAEVLPWPGAASTVRRRAGDPIVAGARVERGSVLGVCSWAGFDRAFARLVLDPRRRLDALAPVSRAARSLVERWAGITAVASAALSFAISRNKFDAAMTAVAVQSGLASAVIGSLAGVYVARGLFATQRRGVTYKSADAWDRAAHASVAVFCARGTLLLGEPEVAEVESLAANIDTKDVLGLAAGAERAETTPSAQAILRASKSRGIKPDAVRNPHVSQGLGVVAVTSSGEELCVGSRAHLLAQRVGLASAERRIGELENLGRSVILVALGGRLVGLVALEDGIRPGARAAVQHLLDARIEPVLMSGDSRETCDAIARSLDLEHVRAEVLPQDRGDEVKHIVESGEHVAVLGHAKVDDNALAAGDVSVALGAAGAAAGEHDVALASEDLRDAALALALAKRTRIEARTTFGLTSIPPALGVLIVALGILPPAFVPIASFIGGVIAMIQGRASKSAA
ncbi:MAG: HAD-IC family P-type ATPase [Polyangiaceae bacterium]